MNQTTKDFISKLINKPSYHEYLSENESVIDFAVDKNLNPLFNKIKMVVENNLHILIGDDVYSTEAAISEYATKETLKFIDISSEVVSQINDHAKEKKEILENIL